MHTRLSPIEFNLLEAQLLGHMSKLLFDLLGSPLIDDGEDFGLENLAVQRTQKPLLKSLSPNEDS
jgi:hypothetical protein